MGQNFVGCGRGQSFLMAPSLLDWVAEDHQARPVARSRAERLAEAKRRLEQQLAVETAANAAYESSRVNEFDGTGRRLGARPKPHTPPALPDGTVNATDPDSRLMRTKGQPTIQGYNVQAAVTAGQIIVGAEVTIESPDFGRRRGRSAARSEWRLIAATHNFQKPHNHWIAPDPA